MGTAVSSRALFLTDPSTAQWCGCSAGGGYSSHFIQFSLLLCVRRCSMTTGKVVFSFSFSLLFFLFLIILKPVSPSSSSRAGVESHLSLSTPLVTLLHVSMPWPHSGACCHLSAKDRAARAAHCCFKAKDELWWKLKLWVCHRWHKVEHVTSYTHTHVALWCSQTSWLSPVTRWKNEQALENSCCWFSGNTGFLGQQCQHWAAQCPPLPHGEQTGPHGWPETWDNAELHVPEPAHPDPPLSQWGKMLALNLPAAGLLFCCLAAPAQFFVPKSV